MLPNPELERLLIATLTDQLTADDRQRLVWLLVDLRRAEARPASGVTASLPVWDRSHVGSEAASAGQR
jgi:hypothetical protein